MHIDQGSGDFGVPTLAYEHPSGRSPTPPVPLQWSRATSPARTTGVEPRTPAKTGERERGAT